ncbi:probable F-box protein At2g36090 [Malania oleifera]|uniref:probable F-box protein At2g36090 n=1 Tax=Malania oleifera TaxID=397392 RepID=UPI0025AE448D|nr:probable F-box protein At2g36090 [Malania oleifera]
MASTIVPPSPTADEGGATTISALHPDILLTHILTRLDGPTLASASCASSQLRAISSRAHLWTDICHSMWPSTAALRLRRLIAAYPGGPRSFFSDCFPLLPPVNSKYSGRPSPPPGLISAVDIRHLGELIFSRVQETETESGWFRCSPFRIDLVGPKDVVATSVRMPDGDGEWRSLAEDLELSWIVADAAGRRAANLSSHKAVAVERHWLSGEVRVRFAMVVAGVEFGTVVTCCGGAEGGELQVREVSLVAEDMEGTHLKGRESMVILQRALEGKKGRGKGVGREEEGRRRYREYLEMKRERRERKVRAEDRMDKLCVVFGASIFLTSCFFFLCS